MFNRISPNRLNWLLRALPNTLWPLKVIFIKKSLKKTGFRFRVGPKCQLFDHRLIEIGNNVFIGDGSIITTVVPVKIGNNVMFGPEVMLIGGDHKITEIGQPMSLVKDLGLNSPITIEDDVWLGARTIVLKGVTIGEGAVVGAGSLVSKNILPYSINVGQPAKLVRCRFNYDDLKKHLELVNSSYKIESISALYQQLNIKL
jgi:acetyltransferase-like isoleucine patch superfamily enzyme